MADGRRCKAGGRVVKNVAGYDLCKLFTGSFGTLGIICELTFKLRPRPAKELTVIGVGSLSSIFAAAWAVYKAGLFPVSLELLSPSMAAELGSTISRNDTQLMIRFAGIESTVDYQAESAAILIKAAGIADVEMRDNDKDLWRHLQTLSHGARQALSFRLNVKPSQLKNVLESIELEEYGGLFWNAGIGDGRLRVMHDDAGSSDQSIQFLANLRTNAESLGGSLVIENASTEIKNRIDVWGSVRTADLMGRVKQQLDPAGLLSPGRFRNGSTYSASAR